MTARHLVENHGIPCVIGECCCYDHHRNVIVLTPEVAESAHPWHLLKAAHEVAHAEQLKSFSIAFKLLWFTPIAAWLESKAWIRAEVLVELALTPVIQCRNDPFGSH